MQNPFVRPFATFSKLSIWVGLQTLLEGLHRIKEGARGHEYSGMDGMLLLNWRRS